MTHCWIEREARGEDCEESTAAALLKLMLLHKAAFNEGAGSGSGVSNKNHTMFFDIHVINNSILIDYLFKKHSPKLAPQPKYSKSKRF